MSSSWDPNEVGPFDRCIRCFTPYTKEDEVAFCRNCGHISLVLPVPERKPKGKCRSHREPFVGYCCLCGKPVCEDCIETSNTRLPLVDRDLGIIDPKFRTFLYCSRCMNEARRIESQFLRRIEERKTCVKHENRPAKFRCIRCGLLLCPSCAYFSYRGLIIKRIDQGPYCLTCFRTAVRDTKKWISGEKVGADWENVNG